MNAENDNIGNQQADQNAGTRCRVLANRVKPWLLDLGQFVVARKRVAWGQLQAYTSWNQCERQNLQASGGIHERKRHPHKDALRILRASDISKLQRRQRHARQKQQSQGIDASSHRRQFNPRVGDLRFHWPHLRKFESTNSVDNETGITARNLPRTECAE